MATPPPKKSVTREDAPGAPEWVDRLLAPLNAFMVPTAAALAQGLTFRENFAGEVRTVEVTPPDDWVPLTLANSWTRNASYVAPAYRQTMDGTVVMRGVLTRSSAPALASSVVTNLPAPDGTQPVVVVSDAGLAMADVSGTASGTLAYYAGGIVRFTLSGVRYTAANRAPVRWEDPVDVKLGTAQTPFPGKPGSVLVVGVHQKNDTAAPVVVTGLDWSPVNLERQKSAPGVRIHRVWGLSPNVTYTLRLLILPE